MLDPFLLNDNMSLYQICVSSFSYRTDATMSQDYILRFYTGNIVALHWSKHRVDLVYDHS